MQDLKAIISKNIFDLRKSMHLTQAELAEKLNYSDKSVSKWERSESIPDVCTLKEIADLFGVTIDYLLESDHQKSQEICQIISKQKKHNRLVITLLSISLIYLIATVIFVFYGIQFSKINRNLWMIYIYAIPVSSIVLLVFNSIWGKRKTNLVIISVLIWSILLSIYLSFLSYNSWLIFAIGISAQIIVFLSGEIKLGSGNAEDVKNKKS